MTSSPPTRSDPRRSDPRRSNPTRSDPRRSNPTRSDPTRNFASGTVWTGDNLPVLRGMNSGCVDLIYLDPPFNSNRTYEAPSDSLAAGASFKDAWTLQDVDAYEHGELADKHPAAYAVIEAARMAHGKSMQSYLIFMAVRLFEMHRVLKPSGSIYLHCDDTASRYLAILMDAIFSEAVRSSFIIWQRFNSHNDARRYGRVVDHILYYARGGATWTSPRLPLAKDYVAQTYRYEDERGRYMTAPLHARALSGGGYDYTWHEVTDVWRFPQKRLDELEADGRIHWPKRGKIPSRKVYLSENLGKVLSNLWIDINRVAGKEKTGYPTQKPLALLERIIRASSNPGDMILDPFCGCATTLVAADRLERQWAGIDISPLAIKLVDRRIADDRVENSTAAERGFWGGANALTEPPRRTDLGKLPNYRTHRHRLYGEQEGTCPGCDTHFPFRVMSVDHILPLSRGGTDHEDNLQLLCTGCNSSKGNKTMSEWRAS